jgi:hypothetical protein
LHTNEHYLYTHAYLFLIAAAIAMKASSTFVAFFALVSRKGIPISSANAYQQTSVETLCAVRNVVHCLMIANAIR